MRPPARSSNPLHNFTLPTLKWGNQRFLRCVKPQSPPPSDHRQRFNHNSTPNSIARKKLTFDHRIVKKLKASILEQEEGAGNDNSSSKPWNLRTRRAACKAPLQRQQIELNMKGKEERLKLSVSLLKEEVEDDFMAMLGTRPPRRPKKRPRIVQKQLDSLFPAFWLTQVIADLYKVAQVPE
ncbi:hypothetical protein Ddye_015408 [Dipteronia dyeriana]|uniref:Uncharacterized protein n=1 Tax=Dipteronia dyeriana TaxID=168575 RepID=A0AAD9U5E4_9ROSI|nr:hypothetical protein Ddye_015408 [Dipteronia dyeriana]